MEFWIVAALGIAVFVLMHYASKADYHRRRARAQKLQATVIENRWEKGPMRGDYTQLAYAYVELTDNPGRGLIKLHYASSGGPKFSVGETVEVFWGDRGELWYWYAYG